MKHFYGGGWGEGLKLSLYFIYMPGLSELKYISTGSSTAYVPPSIPATAFPFTMKSLFSNNAQVFYKPGSLSSSSGGTVINARRKGMRT